MWFLCAVVSSELLVLLHYAMLIDGRRSRPSIWSRNEILFGLTASTAVTLVLTAVSTFVVALLHGWPQGQGDLPLAFVAALTVAGVVPLVLKLRARLHGVIGATTAHVEQPQLS